MDDTASRIKRGILLGFSWVVPFAFLALTALVYSRAPFGWMALLVGLALVTAVGVAVPVTTRKGAITGAVLGALSLLAIALLPSQAVTFMMVQFRWVLLVVGALPGLVFAGLERILLRNASRSRRMLVAGVVFAALCGIASGFVFSQWGIGCCYD